MGLRPLLVLFVFSRCLFWCSGVLWISLVLLVFPRVFWLFKTFGKTEKTNKTKPISKGGSETFNLFCVHDVLFCCRWFSLVFCMFGFPEVVYGFLNTFGKTKNQTRPNPYPRVGLKPLNTLVVWFYRMCVLVFFGLLCYCWLSDQSNEQHLHSNRFVKSVALQPAQAFSFSISR